MVTAVALFFVLRKKRILVDFTSFRVVHRKELTHNTCMVEFSGSISALVSPGQHLLLRDPTTLKSRPYSPTQCSSVSFFIAVKRYENGAVSSFVHSLRPGDHCDMRGPIGNFQMSKLRKFEQGGSCWLFLAAGSGVTPIFSILRHCVLEREGPEQLVLLLSNSSKADLMLGEELTELQAMSRGRLVVKHILSSESGRLNADLLQKQLHDNVTEKIAFVGVCGPPAYCDYVAKLVKSEPLCSEIVVSPPKNETYWRF